MNLKFTNKCITGILTVLPKNEVRFEDEIENYNFSPAKSLKLKLAMGYDKRRVVEGETCVSDLCVMGMNYLFENGMLKKEEIDAMVLVTQSPDYIMPATSSIIQGKLGLKQDMLCIDINQGCAGFIVGLIEAFSLLGQDSINKVILLNADVLSRKVSKKDRNSNPLVGDGASITIIEKEDKASLIYANIKMDGSGAEVLMIPAGGMRLPTSTATGKMEMDANGNFRSKDNLVMKGDQVFNFVQTQVPPMIEDLLKVAKFTLAEVDYFMFHQPNKFMLQKLADKMGVCYSKMPNDIVQNYGNSSGVSIPVTITHTLGKELKEHTFKLCLAGFGVGLTWSSMLIDIGKLSFCEIIEY